MTLCAFGSAPQSTAPARYRVTDADLQSWLGTAYGKLSPGFWSYWFGKEYTIATVCATDPPAAPAISDLDVDLLGNPLGFLAVRQKFDDFISNAVWSKFCQCNGGSGGPCTVAHSVTDSSGGPGSSFLGSFSYYQTPPIGAPVNQWHLQVVIHGPPSGHIVWEIYGPGVPEGVWNGHWFPADGDLVVARDLPSGWAASSYALVLQAGSGVPGSAVLGLNVDWNFSNTPSQPACSAAPTIPPYPTPPSLPTTPTYPTPTACTTDQLCKMLQTVSDQLKANTDLVTLIQRQGVPFAYIPAGTFAGLTGSGEVAVSGILAVSVDASDHPLTSVEFGHPNERFDNGWINLGDADGWFARVQLGPHPTLIPSVPAFVTKVGYSLPPGVTATLRTFKREA